MLIVTAMFPSLLSLFFIRLSLKVIQLRKFHQISFESGGIDLLQRANRKQAHFVEYVPLWLLLMPALVTNRVKGMKYTFFTLSALALSNLVWIAYILVISAQFASVH